jgi:glycosyltransferase involved in cell wall biosynthesis
MKKKIIYIYSEQPDYIRVKKILSAFKNLDVEIHYIGCLRGGQKIRKFQKTKNLKVHLSTINIPHGGFWSLVNTIRFSYFSILKVLSIKPDLIIGVNEELCLPFVIFNRKTPVICEAYDTLSMRSSVNSKLSQLLFKGISHYTISRCAGLVEVSKERMLTYKKTPEKTIIVPNTPSRILDSVLPNKEYFDNKNYIYVSGSFSDSVNGLEQLLKVVEKITPKLMIVAAGRPNGLWVSNHFINHQLVEYVGYVSSERSLEIARKSKGIFAYYKPISLLYKYAAPNKVFDAMMLGVPIIMNSECKMAKFTTENEFGFSSLYEDVEALEKILENIVSDSFSIKFNSKKIQNRFDSKYDWNVSILKYTSLVKSLLNGKNT